MNLGCKGVHLLQYYQPRRLSVEGVMLILDVILIVFVVSLYVAMLASDAYWQKTYSIRKQP